MKIQSYENGKMRVNYNNINSLTVKKVSDYFQLVYTFREKIKLEEKTIIRKFKSNLEIDKLLNGCGFQKFANTYINLGKVSIMEKFPVADSLGKVRVVFYFEALPSIEIIMNKSQLDILENHFLIF